MENVLELMCDYFDFLHEFTAIYNSYSYDKSMLNKLRELSSLNNKKIDEIHSCISNLTSEEKDCLLEITNEIILSLTEEKALLDIRPKNNKYNDLTSLESGIQDIGDKIGDIEHKIYCYERIIIDYLKESKKLKK